MRVLLAVLLAIWVISPVSTASAQDKSGLLFGNSKNNAPMRTQRTVIEHNSAQGWSLHSSRHPWGIQSKKRNHIPYQEERTAGENKFRSGKKSQIQYGGMIVAPGQR